MGAITARRAAGRIVSLLAAAPLLAGCGGGGGGAVVAPVAAAPAPAAAPAATVGAVGCGLDGFAAELLQRVNERRASGAECGTRGRFGPAAPLAWNDALAAAAASHSTDMARRDYFAHTSPDGATMADRANAAGYRWSALAENIAAGPATVAQAVDGWMASEGHCANIMNAALRDVAGACVEGGSARYRSYWTLALGTPR